MERVRKVPVGAWRRERGRSAGERATPEAHDSLFEERREEERRE